MKTPTRTILQLVLVNETGDSYYRMRWPAKELARQNPAWRVINLAANAIERFEWALHADLLVLFQSQDYDLLPVLEARRARGLKTIVEYNDNFYAPPQWSPVAEPWSSPLVWQSYETFIERADCLMVTGQGLVELFRERTKAPIAVIPNHIPVILPKVDLASKSLDHQINLGWAGSLGHMADLLAIAPLLKALVRQYPQITIHLMGNATIPQLLDLPPNRLVFREWGTMEQYFDFWKPVQIGLIPLLDTPYNRCRSDIKAIEMIACGVLPLVPRALPYGELLSATTLPQYSTLTELKALIEQLVANPKNISSALSEPYAHVSSTRMEGSRRERAQLYSEYLPAAITATSALPSWPKDPGYYELDGTPEQSPPSHRILVQVQELWNSKNREQALKLITEGVNANPGNPDLLLAGAKCLFVVKHPQFEECLAQGRKRFSRDLRFRFLEIQSRGSVDERISAWAELTSELKQEPPAHVFRKELFKGFVTDLSRIPQLLSVAEELAQILPDNPEIRLPLAEALERAGRYDEALKQFEWLQSAYLREKTQRDFFIESTESGYVSAWVESLRARLGR